jgi:hypothetical protein
MVGLNMDRSRGCCVSIFCGYSDPIGFSWVQSTFQLLLQHLKSLSIRYIEKVESLWPLVTATAQAGSVFSRINDFVVEYYRENRVNSSLVKALHALRPSQASDPRDKVYAVLGLTRHADLIEVNYGASASKLFTSITRQWIESEKNLHIMDFCYPLQLQGLPSWVVDWSYRAPTAKWPLYKRAWIAENRQNVYSAGGDYPLEAAFEDDSKILVLQGIEYDNIAYIDNSQKDAAITAGGQGAIVFKNNDYKQAFEQVNEYRAALVKQVEQIIDSNILLLWLKDL